MRIAALTAPERPVTLISMFHSRSWIRGSVLSLLLLASMVASTIALPHVDRDADAACSAIPVAHDETAHYIGADATPAPSDAAHCFLCHSLRSFYPAFGKFEQHHYTPRTERLHVAPIDRASVIAWTLVPGRAPPV